MYTFRTEQRKLAHDEQQLVNDIRAAAEELYERIDMIHPGRERDLAKTRLEECFMWAVKAVSASR